jgi:hypothetical protein
VWGSRSGRTRLRVGLCNYLATGVCGCGYGYVCLLYGSPRLARELLELARRLVKKMHRAELDITSC